MIRCVVIVHGYDSVPLRLLIACQLGAAFEHYGFAGDGSMEADLEQFQALLKEGMWEEVMGKNRWNYVEVGNYLLGTENLCECESWERN